MCILRFCWFLHETALPSNRLHTFQLPVQDPAAAAGEDGVKIQLPGEVWAALGVWSASPTEPSPRAVLLLPGESQQW